MFELDDDYPLRSSTSVLVTDYIAGNKSVFVSIEVPEERFAIPDFTIHIIIDAPAYYDPAGAPSDKVFFVDLPSTKRALGEGQFQILYEGVEDDKEAFYRWACDCTYFFKVMQFNVGLVCVDFADFVTVLMSCKGKTLRFVKLKFDPLAEVPFIDESGLQHRAIYGCLASSVDASLPEYIKFENTLLTNNPNLEVNKLAMKIVKIECDNVMFLGEAIL